MLTYISSTILFVFLFLIITVAQILQMIYPQHYPQTRVVQRLQVPQWHPWIIRRIGQVTIRLQIL